MTNEEIEELKGLAASMGLYDDKNPCKRALILGKAIKSLEQQTCEDAVSREAVLDIVNNPLNIKLDKIIEKLPSVNPQPKIGHWIQTQEKDDAEPFILWECSCCHKEFRGVIHKVSNYCPNCGAKMQEAEDGNK